MLSFIVSLILMLAVVGGSMHWAVREQRRRTRPEEPHAGHH